MTSDPRESGWARPRIWVEAFVGLNLAFLAPDILLAHSINDFAAWAQWIPFVVSIAGAGLLAVSWLAEARSRHRLGRGLGLTVAWVCVATGVTGMILHLQDHTFVELTLRNLVYTAPFAAPLAYTGLGMLLLLGRSSVRSEGEWAEWVVVLALGGFVGNFVLSLADHAQNGFFEPAEWIPVAASALAIGFLVPVLVWAVDRAYLAICAVVMGAQVLVGLGGFGLHLTAVVRGPADTLLENLLYGPPVLAPLLFANLAVLAGIGLFALDATRSLETSPPA